MTRSFQTIVSRGADHMGTDDFAPVFDALKAIYARYEPHCLVTADEPGRSYLATRELREKDGYRTAFGGVEIKKRYVSAHLMPFYACPDLLDGVSDALWRRMQGKSCFNFVRLDPSLFAEFDELVARGFVRFEREGRFAPRS
jgi:hypothetical protein